MTTRVRTFALPGTLLLATVLSAPFAGVSILPITSAQAQVRPAPPCDFYCRRAKWRLRWLSENASKPPKPDKPGQKRK